MLLLLVDAVILATVMLAVFLVVRSVIRSAKKSQIEEALFRQKVAEDLAKRVESIDVEQLKLNEKIVNDKLNGLH